VFFVRDGAGIDYLAQAQQQLGMFDANNDGYLEESEFPEQLATMISDYTALDSDGDKKLYPQEVAAFLERRGSTIRSQLRARAGEDRDALFTALDQDHDGRLVARELMAVPQRLTSLDGNADGQVDIEEIPSSMLLGIVRGDPQADATAFQPPAAPPKPVADAPAWFTPMDTNRDGEIDGREFLGEPELFSQYDADGDGFLSPAEAHAVR
jgi:Ca2+-binding EF-hand superfamily protein